MQRFRMMNQRELRLLIVIALLISGFTLVLIGLDNRFYDVLKRLGELEKLR